MTLSVAGALSVNSGTETLCVCEGNDIDVGSLGAYSRCGTYSICSMFYVLFLCFVVHEFLSNPAERQADKQHN